MASLLFDFAIVVGIMLELLDVQNVGLSFGLMVSGGLLDIILMPCYFAEKSRTLIIDTDQIIFPRGARRDGKIVSGKTVVSLCDIRSVESRLHKGIKLLTKDCFFYTLTLKDGTSITVTLYAYGKEAEKEIWASIQKAVV